MADFPSDLRYTDEHEWVRRLTGDRAQVGVTGFAAEQLGDVVNVELPSEGDELEKGEVFGTVESVKSVSDLYAPVSGKVVRINSPLADSPEYVNEDPYGEGWMVEIEMTNTDELEGLMSAADYTKLVESES